MSSTVESTAYELSKLGINGDFATSAPNLHKNIHLLSPEQVLYSICCRTICGSFGVDCDLNLLWPWQIVLAKMLLEIDQSHLFQHWAEPGVDDEEKKAFFDQVCSFCNFFFLFASVDLCTCNSDSFIFSWIKFYFDELLLGNSVHICLKRSSE